MWETVAAALTRYTEQQAGESPFVTALDGVTVLRSDRERPMAHRLYRPALCVVVQGAKQAMFGSSRLDYRAGEALVVNIEMPGIGGVVQATPERPFLGVIVEFDPAVLREVAERQERPIEPVEETAPGIFVLDLEGPLADCIARLVRLLETPEAIPMLRPLIMREICYWLLAGRHGAAVARTGFTGSKLQPIVGAIQALRDRFAEPVRIEELSRIARLSPSAFHRQFKALTLMTPLQYQKQLRLLEARRLMLASEANVESAAFRVGYESPSQFSREYSRTFGASPRRDVVRLRGE